MVSRPTFLGGLGFGLKWDMGWMHDTLGYLARDPIHRNYHHNELTFRSIYSFTENFMLPLSHDEVVHGKGSLLGKMPGDEWQRFANLRLLLAMMFGEPGKKLLFMGAELAQPSEWNHEAALDWPIAANLYHGGISRLVGDLNRVYSDTPALHELDCDPSGFQWAEPNDALQGVLAFFRKSTEGQTLLVAHNTTPVPRLGYRIGVPARGRWVEIVNTDAEIYGGSGQGNLGGVATSNPDVAHRDFPYSIEITVPPLGSVMLIHQQGGLLADEEE
jgi:1,4-alpha-glucan branching enzyme